MGDTLAGRVRKCNKCTATRVNPDKHCQSKQCPWWRCVAPCHAVNDEGSDKFFVDRSRLGQ